MSKDIKTYITRGNNQMANNHMLISLAIREIQTESTVRMLLCNYQNN